MKLRRWHLNEWMVESLNDRGRVLVAMIGKLWSGWRLG